MKKLKAILSGTILFCGLLNPQVSLGQGGEVPAIIQIHANSFIEAFNSKDEDKILDFLKKHWEILKSESDLERVAGVLIALHEDQGEIQTPHIRFIEGRVLNIVGQRAKSSAWENFQFTVEPEGERRIKMVFISMASEPVNIPETPIDHPETIQWIAEQIEAISKDHPFYGVVSIRKGNEIIYEKSVGFANVATSEKNSIETRFNTASGGKMFTSVAIAILLEEKKVSLNQKLVEFLPEMSNFASLSEVTIYDLLSHTSGIGDYWDQDYEKAWGGIISLDQFLPHIIRNIEGQKQGEFAYSNSNFILLGLIIEKISGKSFFEFVEERIFRPAKMTQTSYPIRTKGYNKGFALPYDVVLENGNIVKGQHKLAELGARGSSAGGVSTTINDLHLFANALMTNTLINSETLNKLITPSSADGDFALGFIVKTKNDVFSFGHGGTGPGTEFRFSIYPEQNITIVIASNFSTIATHELDNKISDIMR